MKNDQDGCEFFIGWQAKPPRGIARFVLRLSCALGAGAVILGLAFAAQQQTLARAWYEFGTVREFPGVLLKGQPPVLLCEPPGGAEAGHLAFLLVSPLKHGYPEELAAAWHLKPVTIRGTIIRNEAGGAMLEVVDTRPRDATESANPVPMPLSTTAVKLRGEIVDSKCWLGVMNPGSLKPHRACAINCIRGGIPPALLVDRREILIMTASAGRPINETVLPLIATAVEVSGTLFDYGWLKVLQTDSAGIKPLP